MMTRREMTSLNLELSKEGKRKCTKCFITKNVEDFSYNIKAKKLRKSSCKTCSSLSNKIWCNDNIEYIKQRDKKRWLEQDKDEYNKKLRENYKLNENHRTIKKELSKKYYNNNKETVQPKNREYYKKYRLDNLEMILQKQKEYRQLPSSKEKMNNYMTERRKNDPDFQFTIQIMSHLRGIKNRKDFKEIWDDVKEVYNMYGISYHIDHMIPREWFKIDTEKSLINHIDNLQVIDAHYNLSKGARWSDVVSNDYYQLIKEQIKDEYKDKVEVC